MNLNLENEIIVSAAQDEVFSGQSLLKKSTKNIKSRTRNPNLKSIKVNFDLSNDKDMELYQKISSLLEEVNSGSPELPKISHSDIFKDQVKNITVDHLKNFQKTLITDEHRLKIWCDQFNIKNKTSFSVFEFAVKVLPHLKPKDLQGLESPN